jgi:hypothetical protein
MKPEGPDLAEFLEWVEGLPVLAPPPGCCFHPPDSWAVDRLDPATATRVLLGPQGEYTFRTVIAVQAKDLALQHDATTRAAYAVAFQEAGIAAHVHKAVADALDVANATDAI